MFKKIKALNKFELLAKVVAETVSEGAEKYKKWSEDRDIQEFMENNKKKDTLAKEILELKSTITTLENRYNGLLKTNRSAEVSVKVEGINITLSVEQVINQVKTELSNTKEKHERLSKEFYQLCKQIESVEKKANLGEKVEQITKAKERGIIDRSDYFSRLIPELVNATEYLTEDEKIEEGIFSIYKTGTKIECNFDGLLIFVDLQTDMKRIGSINFVNETTELFAEGESANIKELSWKVEMTEYISKNLEQAYKSLLYTMNELEEKQEKQLKMVI